MEKNNKSNSEKRTRLFQKTEIKHITVIGFADNASSATAKGSAKKKKKT